MKAVTVQPDTGQRQPLLTRPILILLTATVGSMSSFFLLFPVVPLYAAAAGAGGFGAGLSTGTMMLGTVLVELVVPMLLARFGHRAVTAAGVLLLGVPALALIGAPIPLVIAVCLARGAGLGIVVVAFGALAAELAPAGRRAETLGIYGVASGIPSILCMPLGIWLVPQVGYGPVFAAAAVLGLLSLVAVAGLPSVRTPGGGGGGMGVLTGLVSGRLALPMLVFAATTLAVGVAVTFLPLAVGEAARHWASAALLVQSIATPASRWVAGRLGDRYGSHRLLVPAMVAAAAGFAALFWVSNPVAVIAGMLVFGVGFGIAQNTTLTLMIERSSPSEYGRVSAVWNLGYDAGMGVGAVGFGYLIGFTGYPVAFGVTAAVVFAALGLALLDLARHPAKR